MKIDVDFPFNKRWRRAYLVTNKEPRKNVILYNSKKDRTTISYARYLMSIHLGRFLKESEIVDHKNENKMDDRLDNFQILTKGQNNSKSKRFNGLKLSVIECPICKKQFVRRTANTQLAKYHVGRVSCFSRPCSAIFMSMRISKAKRDEISLNTVK